MKDDIIKMMYEVIERTLEAVNSCEFSNEFTDAQQKNDTRECYPVLLGRRKTVYQAPRTST